MARHRSKIKSIIEILLGVFLMDIAYYFFCSPSNLCMGGVTGISIIINNTPLGELSWYEESYFLYAAEFILLIMALVFVSKRFFLRTCLASITSPTYIFIFEKLGLNKEYFLQAIDLSNWYLVSFFVGGLLTAVGIAICLRADSSTGGMDIIQKILQTKLHIPYSKSMYLTDWFVVLLAGFFIRNNVSTDIDVYNIEMVMYGMASVWLTGYVCDYLALNAKSRRTAFIISDDPEKIKQYIFKTFSRGITIVDVIGGYTNTNKKMLVCTVEKKECYIIRDKIRELDPTAFTFFAETKEIVGEYL